VREALLYERLPESMTRCHICLWQCRMAPGKYGVCGMYQNRDGRLFNLNYAAVSSVAVDPIEKKPLYHFFPGSDVFSLGTLGCNFHCKHCQNWQIAMSGSQAAGSCREPSPEAAIDLALNRRCRGVAWTYNEPAVWFEYTLDSARVAKDRGLYTVYVTNGYATPDALDMIGPYLDAWRVDVKGFSDRCYRELAKVPRWREILKTAERARQKWNMHVEVVTNVIPGMNDDDEQLRGIAVWIRDGLGDLTPWHVTRFFPNHRLLGVAATPVPTLDHACDIGRQAGLKFVYAGNVPGHGSPNTTCYSCGRTAIERTGYAARMVGLDGSKCRFCGADLNVRTEVTRVASGPPGGGHSGPGRA
jgi:pyruvate formate lyase activating enzyme